MSRIYQRLLEERVLSAPFVEPDPELLQELRDKVSAIKETVDPIVSPLSIYPVYDGAKLLFHVHDSEGFICKTSSLEVIIILLTAESRPLPDPSRPLYKNGARELLFPGNAQSRESQMLALQQSVTPSRAREMAEQMRARMGGGPSGSSGDDMENGSVVKSVGLP